MKSRSRAAGSLACVAALALAGCANNAATGSGANGATGTGSTAKATGDTIKIMVGGLNKQIYLPFMLAKQLGYYDKAGVNVSLQDEGAGEERVVDPYGRGETGAVAVHHAAGRRCDVGAGDADAEGGHGGRILRRKRFSLPVVEG